MKLDKITLIGIITFVAVLGSLFVLSAVDDLGAPAPSAPARPSRNLAPAQNNPFPKTIARQTDTKPLTHKISQQKQNNKPTHNTPQKVQSKRQVSFNNPDINITSLVARINTSAQAGGMTMSEVAQHHSMNDCYLAINGKVYNVTPYMPYHPAGASIIARYCGQEVTGIFAQIHSNRAWDLLARYKVGSVGARKINILPKVLTAIKDALQKANPHTQVLKVSLKNGHFIAKVFSENGLYELHINTAGKIIKVEKPQAENWSLWEKDSDDR